MLNLDSNITDSETRIPLDRSITDADLPVSGVVLVESEEIHYSSIAGNELAGCTRGFNSTTAVAHDKDTEVTLVIADAVVSPITKISEDQRDRIISPLSGLLIYNTTSDKLNVYNGTAWEEVTSV